MLRVVEDVVALAVLHDGPPVHHRHPVGQVLDHRQVVGDEQIGQAEIALQIQQEVDDPRLDRHVQRRDRLIQCEDLGLQGQRAGDPDALLLPAGELPGVAAGVGTAQPDDLQQLRHPGIGGALVETVGVQGFREEVEHRKARIQRGDRVLKDHLEIAAQCSPPFGGQRRHVVAQHLDGPGLRAREFQDLVQRGRFPRAGLPDDAQRATLLEIEADVVDGAHLADLTAEHHALGQSEGPRHIPQSHDDGRVGVGVGFGHLEGHPVDLGGASAGHRVGADAGGRVSGVVVDRKQRRLG